MNKLFICVLFSDLITLEKTKKVLASKYGKVEKESEVYDFSFTNYYEKEMGKNLKKVICVFEKEIAYDELADIKQATNEIENKFRISGKRTINLDPRMIDKNELVLASVKPAGYKKLIKNAIYYHSIYSFGDKVKLLPMAFPDYKSSILIKFFSSVYKERFL